MQAVDAFSKKLKPKEVRFELEQKDALVLNMIRNSYVRAAEMSNVKTGEAWKSFNGELLGEFFPAGKFTAKESAFDVKEVKQMIKEGLKKGEKGRELFKEEFRILSDEQISILAEKIQDEDSKLTITLSGKANTSYYDAFEMIVNMGSPRIQAKLAKAFTVEMR